MSFNFIWLFVMLFALMALGMPIAFALLVSSFAYISIFKLGFTTAVVQCIQAPMSQTLLSMGFFILAGNLMNNGGVTRRIFRFCQDLVGWIPGGLGHANVVASVIFAGMSGTALGDAGGLGAIEVKAMKDEGFDLDFSLAEILQKLMRLKISVYFIKNSGQLKAECNLSEHDGRT